MRNYETADLARLREDAGVSQAKAAEHFRVSRHTIRSWEHGISKPREKRRQDFQVYLVDKLILRTDPKKFHSAWKVIIKAWSWNEVTETEWKRFFNTPRPNFERKEDIEHLLITAEEAMRQHDYSHAHHCYTEVLKLDFSNIDAQNGKVEALCWWGYQELSMGVYEQANHYFTMALSFDFASSKAKKGKVETLWKWRSHYLAKGYMQDSKHLLRQILVIDPENEEAKFRILNINNLEQSPGK